MSNYQIGISATVLLPRLGDLAGQTRNVLTYQKWKNHEPCNLLAMPLVHDSLKKCLRNAGPSKIYRTPACRKPTNTQGRNRGTVRNAGPGIENHPRNCRIVSASDAEQLRAFLNYKV